MMFKKFLVTVGLALTLITPAYATDAQTIDSIDVRNLSTEQKAELVAQAAKLQEQAKTQANISETVRNEAYAWGEIGANMGKAAVSAAKELGVAANEFVQTPMGKITMALVIYKVAGEDILGVIIGVGVIVFFFSLALYFVLKNKYSSAEYEYVDGIFGKNSRRVLKSYRIDDDQLEAYYICAAICGAVGLVVGLATIF